MTSREAAKMSGDDFVAACKKASQEREEAKLKRLGKAEINTSSLTLEQQIERFKKSSFTENEMKKHFKDATSI